jgi:hypothetical protein
VSLCSPLCAKAQETNLFAMGTGGYYARRFSPVGQGFMIEGTATGNVLMKK